MSTTNRKNESGLVCLSADQRNWIVELVFHCLWGQRRSPKCRYDHCRRHAVRDALPRRSLGMVNRNEGALKPHE